MKKSENIISFKNFDKLPKLDKSTKRTEIGGDVLNENLVEVVASVVNDASFMTNIQMFVNSLTPKAKAALSKALSKKDKKKEA